jgi:glycosyltransferase involved in cell wall biosynthesis
MKIAFQSVFYPYRGGIAQFSEQVAASLQKKHDVLNINFCRQYPDFLFPGTSQYDENLFSKARGLRIIDSINPFSWLSASRKINAFEADYLISSYWMSFLAPALGSVAFLSKVKKKKIALVHNAVPHERRFFDALFTPYFLRANDAFVVLSENVKADLHGLTRKPIFLHPHPVYEHFGQKIEKREARKKIGIPDDKKVLLFFGLIRPYKGLDLLLEAFDELPSEYLLLIAGESYEDTGKYEELIRQNRNRDRIIFHAKYIPDDEVPFYFSAADTNVLPYRNATQSGVTAVAYHFDLPLIVNNVGNLGKAVEEHQSGVVNRENTPQGLQKAVQNFFSDETFSERAKKGIGNFKKNYSWDNFADFLTGI